MNRLSSFLFFILACLCAQAQFTDVTSNYSFTLEGTSTQDGCGVSFYDYDNDGWDDLTVGQTNADILVFHNNLGDYQIAFTFPNTSDPKQLIWVDYDNDGDADFFFTTINQSSKLFRNDGGNIFTDVTASLNLPLTNAKSFGACWGDYDNDGWLDFYICNYNQAPSGYMNWLFHNNGDGTFSEVAAAMGVSDGHKPHYQPAWVDVNLDGLLDLYVVSDFDYVNSLFLNNGTTFDDVSATYGLNIAVEGMSNSWSDFDFDGDLDVFVANNLDGNMLMRNDDGLFTDIAPAAGVEVNSTCWSSMWMDYDNDGLDDLHIATSNLAVNGNQNYLFRNDGDYTFTDHSMVTDNKIVFATAKGDKNNDGYWDYIEMKQFPTGLQLWQNNGGARHWVKASLEGTVSNRDGVGSIIRYYYNETEYMRHTFYGEQFMSQDSQHEILSMSSFTMLDSLSVTWPSGWVDTYYNLAADESYTFVEGETFSSVITNLSDRQLCADDVNGIALDAGDYETFMWSDDSTTRTINVTQPGTYEVTVTNEFGFESSASYEVSEYGPIAVMIADYSDPSCFGSTDGFIALTIADGEIEEISWNDVHGDTLLEDIGDGAYEAHIVDGNGCETDFTVTLEQPDALEINLSADMACFNGTIEPLVLVTGGTGEYTLDWNGDDGDALMAGAHTLTVTDENLCEASEEIVIEEFPEIIITLDALVDTVCYGATTEVMYNATGGVGGFTYNWDDEDPTQLGAGMHTLIVTDELCQDSSEIFIPSYTELQIEWNAETVCYGETGSATVVVTGGTPGYELDWDGEDPSSLPAGTYPLLVTDHNLCTKLEDVVVEQYDEITIALVIDTACYNGTGSVMAIVTGGTPDYMLDFNGADTDALLPGEYVLDVSDINACTATALFEVEEFTEIIITSTIENANGGNNGSATLNVSGGSSPYEYLWSDESTGSILNNAGEGTYTVEVTDASGCVANASVDIIDIGISENEMHVLIYPIPFSDQLTITFEQPQTFTIEDAVGRIVYASAGSAVRSSYSIETSSWSEGVYFIRSGGASRKLVK